MKILFRLLIISITLIISGCAGNKDLQATAPAQFQQAFFTSLENSITLHIPVSTIQTNRVSLDSVYFRGRKAPLKQEKGVYIADFQKPDNDMILSSDPKEEYANKLPERAVKVPFDLNKDEAVIVFRKNKAIQYYKIGGIEERSLD